MNALVFYEPGVLLLQDIPLPAPSQEEVLLKVITAGICQTDVEIFKGNYPIKTPRVLGHEFVGEVVEPGISGLPPGSRVAIYPPIFCGKCYECLRGNLRHCHNFRCLGNTDNGGWAEYVAVHRTQVYPIDTALTDAAVWLEPLACVLHALSTFPPAFTGRVLILGGGSMGLLFLQALKALHGSQVAVADPHESRLDLARKLGTDWLFQINRGSAYPVNNEAINEVAPFGFDLIVDTTGNALLLQQCIAFAGNRSQVIEFGVPSPEEKLELPLLHLFNRQISISGAVGNDLESFLQGLSLINAGRIATSHLVEKKVHLRDVPDILLERSKPGPKGKVLIECSKSL